MLQFSVLMWKHLTERKKKYVATTVELLSPCLFFIAFLLFKSYLIKKVVDEAIKINNGTRRSNVYDTEAVDLEHIIDPRLILYTPVTYLTDTLMDDVAKSLHHQRLNRFPNHYSQGLYGFSRDEVYLVNKLLLDMKDTTAVVIFQNMSEGDIWPSKLNYTIRTKLDFKTKTEAWFDDEIEPHPSFGTIYEPFMRLQWAVDSSYLRLKNNNTVGQKTLHIQEFSDNKAAIYYIYSIAVIMFFMNIVCVFSLFIPFTLLLVRLLEERASGVQELVKMVGVSNSMLAFTHFVNMLPVGLIYAICGTVVSKAGAQPFLPNSNGFLLFLLLILHFCSIMALCFVMNVNNSTEYASSQAMVCYIVTFIIQFNLNQKKMPAAVLVLTGLLPQVPLNWYWNEVGILEIRGKGVGFSTMFKSHSPTSCSTLVVYIMLILQTLLYFMIAWYISKVLPGKYGVAKPWNFLWQRKKKATLEDPEEESRSERRDPRYFEDMQGNTMEVGIKIVNVYKMYPKFTALSNVSFDIYKGEITVLLGHNGAGKTTLMNIITGMSSATKGKVFVNGMDISRDRAKLRRQLGLCPQHNLFFPALTNLQHLMFFAMLKGNTKKQAHKSSMELLSRLGLEDKAHSTTSELSGGMKRRLQLACALSGGSSVLILDEPTSGLDVETRRELWDLLLSLRGDRTVLLTTHFMEEADALGDRVAALHQGTLRCHATPMYLKKNIGTGYRLSLTTVGLPQESNITSLITSIIPAATLKESSYNTVSYNLPAQDSNKFPQLFSTLESKRSDLGIDSIGVGISSLEEVFLKLCSDIDTEFTQETVDTSAREPTFIRQKGCQLYLHQAYLLMRRQMRYLLFKKYGFLVFQVILPIAVIFIWTRTTSGDDGNTSNANKLTALDLDVYQHVPSRRVLYNVDETYADAVQRVKNNFQDVDFRRAGDVSKVVFRDGEGDDSLDYHKNLIGVEINATNAKILYTSKFRDAAPIALNVLSNILACQQQACPDGRTITTNNHPLEEDYIMFKNNEEKLPKIRDSCMTWSIIVAIVLFAIVENAVNLPIKERVSGTRHIHVMSGCPPAVLWISALVALTFLYLCVLVVPIALIGLADKDETFNKPSFICSLVLILLLATMAYLALCFLVSFSFGELLAPLVLTAIWVLGIFDGFSEAGATIMNEKLGAWTIPVMLIYYTLSPATTTSAIIRATMIARENAYCELNPDKCSKTLRRTYEFYAAGNNFNNERACYLCFKGIAPLPQMIILTVQTVVYMFLVILTQYGAFNSFWDRINNKNYKPGEKRYNDNNVQAEKTYVSQTIELPPTQIRDALLANDLYKNYLRCSREPLFTAVKGISFSVKKGECFGLLGVNGAGKSTTFKMLTGEESATRGGVFANSHHLKWPRSPYLQSLGYCPQFFGLDEFLSGRENLNLLLTLRGLRADDVKAETEAWIQVVGLEKYRDKLVHGYSGGCMRRLATAAALSSGAPVTLLDEPTAGVDVSARRRVWVALKKGLRQNRAVIITSHSMDEMEALCDRIAIMSGGELAALGSPAELRAAYAAGHALVLKLAPPSLVHRDPDSANEEAALLLRLKETVEAKFNCTLKDEHRTMLHYHINETMRYSELFSALEQLKQEFPEILQDYSVTETTLEEVFLSFAQPVINPTTTAGAGQKSDKTTPAEKSKKKK